jgi:hypothetical protein
MERAKEFLKKVPWPMVILVTWMIVSQYFAMQLVIVPAVMALLGTLFVPVLLPVFFDFNYSSGYFFSGILGRAFVPLENSGRHTKRHGLANRRGIRSIIGLVF